MPRSSGSEPSQRQLRVGEALRHALAELLSSGALHDPDVQGAPVTVTEVRVSPNLRMATAYIVPLGGGDPATVLGGLRRAAPHIRSQLARMVQLRFAPQFIFEVDNSFDHASRIEALLRATGDMRGTLVDDEDDDGA